MNMKTGNKKMFRVLSFVLAMLMVWNLTPMYTLKAQEAEAENTSKEYQEIIINSVEDFIAFADNCYIDSWSADKKVSLMCNIDLTGTTFKAIPVFSGIFEGNEYTISGFDYEGDGYVTGLFRYIEAEGVVENLTVKGNVTSGDEEQCIGGICGMNYGTIKNCNFQGIVSGKSAIGGIAGINQSTGTITKCSVQGKVSGYYYTGGVAGKNHGVISSCTNVAGVNNDSSWVEEDDEMGAGWIKNFADESQDAVMYSGVDTGGIAGYSDGMIVSCTNKAQIGYEHTGYNIGGIAGRQSGIISLCTNRGTVYGRKDIGGIVGQMEPYIEVIEADTLQGAINTLHDLIDKTIDDMQAGKDVIASDIDELQNCADAAIDTGKALSDKLSDFAEQNMDQAEQLVERMEYVVDSIPEVIDSITLACEYLNKANESIKQLNKDADISGKLKENTEDYNRYQEAVDNIDACMRQLEDASGDASQSIENIDTIIRDEEGNLKEWRDLTEEEQDAVIDEVTDMMEYTVQMQDQTAEILRNLGVIARVMSPYVSDMQDAVHKDIEEATGHIQESMGHFKNAAEKTKGISDYLSAQSDLEFTRLGDDYREDKDTLYNQLKAVSSCIDSLSNNGDRYSDIINQDLKAVNDQLNVVFNIIIDKLEAYSNGEYNGNYEDVSDEDIEATTTGKVEGCKNKGNVEGDINIGGIAGAMAIDEEDLEGNAAGKADVSFGSTYLTKCVIANSTNEGFVTAKKDGAGGIAGYMKLGVITDSKAYGGVESTEGSYVGGVCGESLTMIRRSYALCSVSGSKYVGGIAGYGDSITDCYAMVYLDASIGRQGAIAGQIAAFENEEENQGNVSGNCYVGDGIYGIDGISYAGVAEPVTYEELLTMPGLPKEFWNLTVTYRVGKVYLGSQVLGYGESLTELDFPEIPEKEGYYGVWEDVSDRIMTGNIIIDGEYVENVKVLESVCRNEEHAPHMPYAYAQNAFTKDTVLYADMQAAVSSMAPWAEAEDSEYVVYDVSIENITLPDTEVISLRLLNPYDKAEVWYYNGESWEKAESKIRGQYLQVDMTGLSGTFCVVKKGINMQYILIGAGAAAVIAVFVVMIIRIRKSVKKKRKNKK